METDASRTVLGLGGGCHWCTEAVFESLAGVASVEQGHFRSDPPHEAWSEGARVAFDERRLPLGVLLEVHLRTHASTSAHSFRERYRSAVYAGDGTVAARVRAELARLQPGFDAPLVTRVLADRGFRESPPEFRGYYRTGPDRPFCRTYIDPKLARLRRDFAGHLRARPGPAPPAP